MHVFITTRRAKEQIEQRRYWEKNWRGWRVTRSCHVGRRWLVTTLSRLGSSYRNRHCRQHFVRSSEESRVFSDAALWFLVHLFSNWAAPILYDLTATSYTEEKPLCCTVCSTAEWQAISSMNRIALNSEPSPSVGGVDFHCTGTAKSSSLRCSLPVLLSLLIRYFLQFWKQPATFWAENGPTKILL